MMLVACKFVYLTVLIPMDVPNSLISWISLATVSQKIWMNLRKSSRMSPRILDFIGGIQEVLFKFAQIAEISPPKISINLSIWYIHRNNYSYVVNFPKFCSKTQILLKLSPNFLKTEQNFPKLSSKICQNWEIQNLPKLRNTKFVDFLTK